MRGLRWPRSPGRPPHVQGAVGIGRLEADALHEVPDGIGELPLAQGRRPAPELGRGEDRDHRVPARRLRVRLAGVDAGGQPARLADRAARDVHGRQPAGGIHPERPLWYAPVDGTTAWLALAGVTVACLIVGAIVFSRNENLDVN